MTQIIACFGVVNNDMNCFVAVVVVAVVFVVVIVVVVVVVVVVAVDLEVAGLGVDEEVSSWGKWIATWMSPRVS